mmetsp:Transcript_15487/g.13521  ORF Transcript_15487/g.13521 Transcript_15487/m.13521 type:complete len:249 (+) Transcript_15487:205-951(+)
MLARETYENGSMVFVIIYLGINFVKAKIENKPFWKWEDSPFRNPETGGFHWKSLSGNLIYAVMNIISGFTVVWCFQFAVYGNMSQGILAALFGLSSIFSAILSYYIFGDKLKNYHIIGMILMLVCIVGLGIGGSTKNQTVLTTDGSENSMLYAFLAVIFGVISPILFALGGVVVNYCDEHYKFDPFSMSLWMYFFSNIVLTIMWILTYEYGSHPFIWREYLILVFGGVITCIGIIFLNTALTLGLSGP